MGKVGSDKSGTVADIPMACADEGAAVAFLEDLRWGDTPCCPRCGDCDVYQMQSRAGGRERGYRWRPAELKNGKVWWTTTDDPEAEIAWLRAEVYGREVSIPVHPITACERYSDRLWSFGQ